MIIVQIDHPLQFNLRKSMKIAPHDLKIFRGVLCIDSLHFVRSPTEHPVGWFVDAVWVWIHWCR